MNHLLSYKQKISLGLPFELYNYLLKPEQEIEELNSRTARF